MPTLSENSSIAITELLDCHQQEVRMCLSARIIINTRWLKKASVIIPLILLLTGHCEPLNPVACSV